MNGVQRFQILRAVGRKDGDPITRLHAAAMAQVRGQTRDAIGQRAVVACQARALHHGGPLSIRERGAVQQLRDIHRAHSVNHHRRLASPAIASPMHVSFLLDVM